VKKEGKGEERKKEVENKFLTERQQKTRKKIHKSMDSLRVLLPLEKVEVEFRIPKITGYKYQLIVNQVLYL
jgi:hypothetical protein